MHDFLLPPGIKWLRVERQRHACNFIKIETLAQVFSYEFCEISNNIFSYRTSRVAASALRDVPLGFYKYGQNSGKILVSVNFLVKLLVHSLNFFRGILTIVPEKPYCKRT